MIAIVASAGHTVAGSPADSKTTHFQLRKFYMQEKWFPYDVWRFLPIVFFPSPLPLLVLLLQAKLKMNGARRQLRELDRELD